MSLHHQAEIRPLDALPVQRLLEALSLIHRWIFVVDAQRRVVWMSERLREIPGIETLSLGDDARAFLAKLPRPEQVFPLRSSLRGRSHLRGAPLEVRIAGGELLRMDLDLLRLEGDGGDMLVVVASEHAPDAERGPDGELVDALSDAVIALDADGFVRRVNAAACRLLGYTLDEIVARPIATLLGRNAEEIETLAESLSGPPRSARCEIRMRDGSGRIQALDVTISPLGAGGRALVLHDVSAQQERQRELASANEELEHCVGALAHDLRSPLVGVLGFSRLLRQDYGDLLDETGRHFVDRIEQGARTMESLIHDLLELARIGETGERPILVDCQAVLRQLAAELKPRLEDEGIELILPTEGVSRVYCDRARLYQVFSNLIGNAIDHMGSRSRPRIEVRVEESDAGHEISVADNGRGVDLGDRERIFEIFQSVGKRSDGRRGTGMGLAIVKKIVEKYGGRVWHEPVRGGGARFHATFPHG